MLTCLQLYAYVWILVLFVSLCTYLLTMSMSLHMYICVYMQQQVLMSGGNTELIHVPGECNINTSDFLGVRLKLLPIFFFFGLSFQKVQKILTLKRTGRLLISSVRATLIRWYARILQM